MTRSAVTLDLTARALRFSLGSECFFRTETKIRAVVFQKRLQIAFVDRQPLGLPVRSESTPRFNPLVPRNAKPSQLFCDVSLELRLAPFDVRVLDTEHKSASVALRKEKIEECGARSAQVQ
ncbi:MAG: hypothetical protein A2682_01135 [Candidatus Terrybacteria bacterium RIFCSPHIGHO2_01_FULL_58_15]|uniref:Uncharacterized protein n=1 Tax=Terrybacteria sp. (strain RIFCSPHIGHO2_01_FULL_58_15) TaxID=1802363 RepID=A0A1G2PNR7_TERXR|nr:MAG: hypothetical protein A2682_01135 [Candidatus Terrybacteria bacterium RIFCSPHIGHO2_01_FULL_58_15]